MSYQKHKWVTNEIIRAKWLNHIEDGIYDEEQRALNAEEALSYDIEAQRTWTEQQIENVESSVETSEGVLEGKITANTNAISTLNAGESTVGSVDYKIAQAMTSMGGYIVTLDHTQVESPSPQYIYLEPDSTATGTDKWREWIWIYDEDEGDYVWTLIGDVSLDLSSYVKKTDYATTSAAGVVKPDGITIIVSNGVISASSQGGGVSSFNGRTGAVTPQSGDYTKSDVGLGNVGNFKAVSTEASQGLTTTEKSNARTNIGAGTSSFSGSYPDLTNKPTIPGGVKIGTSRSGATDTTLYFIRS